VIENQARATYSDLDRAAAMHALRKLGMKAAEVEALFGIGPRQRQRLERLLDFPLPLQEAVASGRIPSTHAVRLMQHCIKFPDTDLDEWIERLSSRLTYKDLNRALRSEQRRHRRLERPPFSLLHPNGPSSPPVIKTRALTIRPNMPISQKNALAAHFRDLAALLSTDEQLP